MGFQVAPQRVGPRRAPVSGLVVIIAGAAIVAVALATAAGSRDDRGSAVQSESEPRSESAAPSHRPAAGATTGRFSVAVRPPAAGREEAQPPAVGNARPVPAPSSIRCHGTGQKRCSQIAFAAIRGLPAEGPPVETVSVWDSIVCGSDEDCPASRFKGYVPLGSAIVSFGRGHPRAWLNVVEPAPYPGWVWVPADSRAWIIRWQG